jgi:hypothetical protein
MSAAPLTLPVKELAAAIHDQAYPDHPYFPQLKMASDSRSMLDFFRRHLKPKVSALHIERCVPVRFRFRRNGSSCVLQYALRLSDHANADESVSNVWVTCVICANEDDTRKLYAGSEGTERTIPESWTTFAPLTFVPELQMLVYVFPYDRSVTRLPSVLDGPWPELQERLLDRFGRGRWQIEHQSTEPLRYRPEDSAVIRYAVRASNGAAERETKCFYAKVNRTRYGRDVCQLLHHIQRGLSVAGNDFSVVEPLFYCSDRRCLVLAEAPGRSLQSLLNDPHEHLDKSGLGSASINALRRLARAMTAFNQSDVPTTVVHSAEQQIRWLTRTAQLLCWACPSWSALVKNIVKEVSARLRDVPHAPIQWDLKPDHVFLDGDRVIFIDLDTVSLGDPARDPAHLAAHLACRIDLPEMSPEAAQVGSRTVVEEYFEHVPANWRNQFTLQYAIAMLEAACGQFKRQEPGWAEQAPAAIQEAQRALGTGFA